jgi:RNA polymerase sigma-70 factor (ECF subfamily)
MISRLEELSLIARCVAGDSRDAFGRLVSEYEGPLRRFLLNLTLNDASLTDDLAQETFLKAYLAIRSFKGIARFKTWLYSIAYNEFVSYRRKQREVATDLTPTWLPDETDSQAATDAKLDVATLISRLNDAERSVVLLFYLEDQPIDRISKITGMPTGTIKSYLSRARSKMATLIQK